MQGYLPFPLVGLLTSAPENSILLAGQALERELAEDTVLSCQVWTSRVGRQPNPRLADLCQKGSKGKGAAADFLAYWALVWIWAEEVPGICVKGCDDAWGILTTQPPALLVRAPLSLYPLHTLAPCLVDDRMESSNLRWLLQAVPRWPSLLLVAIEPVFSPLNLTRGHKEEFGCRLISIFISSNLFVCRDPSL